MNLGRFRGSEFFQNPDTPYSGVSELKISIYGRGVRIDYREIDFFPGAAGARKKILQK